MKHLKYILAILVITLMTNTATTFATDKSIKFTDQLGGFGTKAGKLKQPFGITIDKTGNIYIANTGNNRIDVYNSNHDFKKSITNSRFKKPTGVAIDGSGNIYISDCFTDRIYKYSKHYKFIKSWGGSATVTDTILEDSSALRKTYSKFNCPISLTTDNDNNIFVADMYNNRIQKFTSNGKYLLSFGSKASTSDSQLFLSTRTGVEPKTTFNLPSALTFKDDKLFVVDSINNRVQVFDSDGKFIKQFGGIGNIMGRFKLPSSVAVDTDGNIYIAEFKGNKITVFNKYYQFKTKWGGKGIGNMEFEGITGLAVDKDGFVYVSDYGNHRVKKFKLFLSK